MIYKCYVKAKGKFPKHNYLGAPIGEGVKIATKIAKKKKTLTTNTRKIVKRKKTMTIKNSILYDILVNRESENRNPLFIKLQRISKMVSPGGTYSSRTYCYC